MNIKRLLLGVATTTATITIAGVALQYYVSSAAQFSVAAFNSTIPVTKMTLPNMENACQHWLHQYKYAADVEAEWVSLSPIYPKTYKAHLNYGGENWFSGTGFMVSIHPDVSPRLFSAITRSAPKIFKSIDRIKCRLGGGMEVQFIRLLTVEEKRFLSELADIHL